MRHTASSHRQMKALFFILLLAGHDAVRVTQEAEWSKSKWNELHADCSWSLRKGCSEGCVRKPLPLDLPGESCRHTNAYLLEHNGLENYHAMIDILIEKSEKNLGEAVEFIVGAFLNENFVATLDESETASLNDGFQKVLTNLAESQDEAETMRELIKKLKCQRSNFMQKPKRVLVQVVGLSQALLSDIPDAKRHAKLQLEAMPESCGPVSAEEEAEGLVQLKHLQKESEELRGEASEALDGLDEAIDLVLEEANEMENTGSALQLSNSKALALQNSTPPLLPLLFSTVATVGMMALLIYGAAPFFLAAFAAVAWWGISAMAFCMMFGYSDPDKPDCAKSVFLLPFKAVKSMLKGAAKGVARVGKGIYKYFKGNASNTSALFETEAFMDELAKLQAEALAEEVSVS
eukprot:Skav206727  [mRNA]  locus=scaffold967:243392:245164:- [translate_table: standard]